MHLGCWPDHTALADLIASARAGGTGAPPDVDAVNARVTAAHRDASRDEVLAALRRNREATADYLAERARAELDTAPTVSVGRPHAAAERRPRPGLRARRPRAGPGRLRGRSPAAAVLQSGLAALADVTGALAAAMGITGGATLATPDGGWRFAADAARLDRRRVAAGGHAGTAVEAPADLLLEAASGRVNPVPALARRRLKVHELGGLLQLAPIVQAAPGHPGRADPPAGRPHARRRGRRARPAVRQGVVRPPVPQASRRW